jgi:hypothetical protein
MRPLGIVLRGRFLFVRGSKNFEFLSIPHPSNNVVGFIRTLLLPSVATRFTQKSFLKIKGCEDLSFCPSVNLEFRVAQHVGHFHLMNYLAAIYEVSTACNLYKITQQAAGK